MSNLIVYKMKKSANLFLIFWILSLFILVQGCKKGELPEIATVEITGITINSAISGGTIISDGGCDLTEKGVCWNTTGNPTTSDPKSNSGTGSDNFSSNITGLASATKYYVRAFAKSEVGTAYGEEIVFNTKVADAEGNQYNTVNIGTQVWMAENLKATKYNDNTEIPLVEDNTAWSNLTSPGYCWVNNNEAVNKPLYGALYNWYAANNEKLCPAGWHVPTDVEFKTMEMSLGLSQAAADQSDWRGTDQGKQMKNTTGWSANENGTNTSGFSALPGGYRHHTTSAYNGLGILGYWWCSNGPDSGSGWYRRLDGGNNAVYRASTLNRAGKSVRCIKN